mmetsp:Transcript_56279/g.150413  ORF Transcript_56279/g.150413 Transcript_56279/m.150413 type:complete len:269 (-) Transcript_56279:57-863(-)
MAESMWWSRWRVLGCLYAGAGIITLTWSLSYILWLVQGCRPFLPFVSDFAGGDSGPLFLVGLTATALVLLPTWFDHFWATRRSLDKHHAPWRCMHRVLPFLGVCLNLSVVSIALNPWDIRMHIHLMSADGYFYGGIALVAVITVMEYRRGFRPHYTLALLILTVVSLVCMIVFLSRGFAQEWHGSPKEALQSMQLMRDDFPLYCKGEPGTLHSNRAVNTGAFYEWLLIASIGIVAFLKLHTELQDWPQERGVPEENVNDHDNSLPLLG